MTMPPPRSRCCGSAASGPDARRTSGCTTSSARSTFWRGTLATERRRTYSLNPDDKFDDRAGVARAGRAAREILRRQIEDQDEELLALAREVRVAWREVFGGDAATER
jgi:hypothetical protein